MRIAARVPGLLSVIVINVVLVQAGSAERWHYPDDAKAILSEQPPTPYSGDGLPVGVVSILTTYRKPGLLVSRPGRSGYWQFENVAKLFYKGKQFALVGTGTCFSRARHALGCITDLVIYDEDGDGIAE